MNKVLLTGHIVKDSQIRNGENTTLVRNTIAVKREKVAISGTNDVDYINFVAFGKDADFIIKYIPKGSLVEIIGHWQHSQYTDKEGKTKYDDVCVVERIFGLVKPSKVNTPYVNANNNYNQNNLDDENDNDFSPQAFF